MTSRVSSGASIVTRPKPKLWIAGIPPIVAPGRRGVRTGIKDRSLQGGASGRVSTGSVRSIATPPAIGVAQVL
jgi:hypothetical protein